jgi:hypothetical protein
MLRKWEQFLIEKAEETHKFSCTMVMSPKELTDKVIAWGKANIPNEEIHTDPDGGKGRELEGHVTVLYGIHATDPKETAKVLQGIKPPKITLGKTSVFDYAPGFDVVKISIISPDLHKMSDLLRKKVAFTNKFDYVPHMTIAYVKKGKGEKYTNDDTFAGMKFIPDKVVFSGSNGKRADIKLGE